MNNKYYIYVYLNPNKKGHFKYGDYEFEYEPFYVGKGSSDRESHHIRESRMFKDTNKIKLKILKSLKDSGLEPIIIKLYENLVEEMAYDLEGIVIGSIGKIIDGDGPLTNIKDGGNGFTSDDARKTWLKNSIKEKRITGLKRWWDNRTEQEKKRIL